MPGGKRCYLEICCDFFDLDWHGLLLYKGGTLTERGSFS
jgi:hypothetical protein